MIYNYDENDNKQYTWKKTWKNKYESIWGLTEKFRYVNTMSVSCNKLLSFRYGATSYTFDSKLLCNRRGRLNLDSPLYNWSADIPLLHKINEPEQLFYNSLRYCPICMKKGYHSILHQAKFFDYCFIHDFKLIERCKCSMGYSVEYKNDSFNAFQCKKCNAIINEIPPAIDGILNDWKINIKSNIVNESHDTIKAIYYIDPNIKLSNSIGLLTDNQKNALKNLIILDRIEECISEIIIEKDAHESIINNVHKLIEQKFHGKYGFDYCKKQYVNIRRWNSIEDLDAVDYHVVSYFYLMNEFLLRSYSDCIYPKEYGNSLTDIDTEWNVLLEISCSWRHWRDISITRTKNEESKNNVISNYIYKDLIKQRYKDILNFMLEHYTSKSRLCDLSFPYTEAYYKTYLIIEYEDGRIFIY